MLGHRFEGLRNPYDPLLLANCGLILAVVDGGHFRTYLAVDDQDKIRADTPSRFAGLDEFISV